LNARFASRLHALALAVICVITATALRMSADPLLGRSVPYLLFYPAVMLAAMYGGFWSGALATALSAVVALYAYLGSTDAFGTISTAETFGLLLFVGNGFLISRLSERARRGEESQQQLAAIVESSDDAIVGIDLQGTIRSWNHGAAQILGYSSTEMVGKPIQLIIPPDRHGEEQRALARISAGHRIEPFETVRRRKDSTDIDVSLTMSPIKNAEGVVIGASKIARDITQRRREERLRDELTEKERIAREEALAVRERLSFLAEVGTLLGASLDYSETLDRAVHLALPRLGDYCNVVIEDEGGRVRHAAWGHVDRGKEPLLRELVTRLLDSERSASVTMATAIMTTGKSVVLSRAVLQQASDNAPLDPQVVALGRELMPCAYVGVPLHVGGRVVGVLSFGATEQESGRQYTATDVAVVEEFARRVSLAIENARLYQQAAELNRLKDEFLATVSHELRTPLSAVLGWSRMLSNGQLTPEKAVKALQAIERNAQAQAKLVDDIIDVARGLAGNVHLELRPVDLTRVAHQAMEAITPAAVAKSIEMEVRTRHAIVVNGDSARLRQVVWNVLSNAVKFTPSGGRVTIDVSRVAGSAELHVTDTGVGIARDFLPHVFEKFRQADGSFTRQHGGLGLGLAIARNLIELHGGSIEARSAGEGSGATFVVRLPLAARPGATSAQADPASAPARGVTNDVPEHDQREGHSE
jgi:PAS domain S-box-containing protein